MMTNKYWGDGEEYFTIEADTRDGREVTIHPWDRGEDDKKVYIDIFDPTDGMNLIVDREIFISGLLSVFPELQRSDVQ